MMACASHPPGHFFHLVGQTYHWTVLKVVFWNLAKEVQYYEAEGQRHWSLAVTQYLYFSLGKILSRNFHFFLR